MEASQQSLSSGSNKYQEINDAVETSPYANSTSAIQNAVGRLKELDINFLAIDFDQTILDVHTGGRWEATEEELFPHVRPAFFQLIEAARGADIEVAVVTFSRQTHLVRGILDWILGVDGSSRVPIRGNDRSWQYKGRGSKSGKQAHMASAVEELEQRYGVEITRKSTLLIDDDDNNIRCALGDGVRAIWFNPEKPHKLLPDMIRLV